MPRPKTVWTERREIELRLRWDAGESMGQIARAMGVTRNSIVGKSNRLNLQFHHGESRPIPAGSVPDIRATTRFPSRVQAPGKFGVLKSGAYQRKLGAYVTKGRWRGMPIFSLSLEERATCPRSCQQWLSCYGNASGMSVRYTHGPELLAALAAELDELDYKHPNGFVVRLHQLGDFPSVEYVDFWRAALLEFRALRIFGYSARQADDPIGAAVITLRDECWDRFAIRTSGAQSGPRTAVVDTAPVGRGVIVCPAQTGRVSHCGACGICWAKGAREKPVLFLKH